jgi:hypothetical protein
LFQQNVNYTDKLEGEDKSKPMRISLNRAEGEQSSTQDESVLTGDRMTPFKAQQAEDKKDHELSQTKLKMGKEENKRNNRWGRRQTTYNWGDL